MDLASTGKLCHMIWMSSFPFDAPFVMDVCSSVRPFNDTFSVHECVSHHNRFYRCTCFTGARNLVSTVVIKSKKGHPKWDYNFSLFVLVRQMMLFPANTNYSSVFRPTQPLHDRIVYTTAAASNAADPAAPLLLLLTCLCACSRSVRLWATKSPQHLLWRRTMRPSALFAVGSMYVREWPQASFGIFFNIHFEKAAV